MYVCAYARKPERSLAQLMLLSCLFCCARRLLLCLMMSIDGPFCDDMAGSLLSILFTKTTGLQPLVSPIVGALEVDDPMWQVIREATWSKRQGPRNGRNAPCVSLLATFHRSFLGTPAAALSGDGTPSQKGCFGQQPNLANTNQPNMSKHQRCPQMAFFSWLPLQKPTQALVFCWIECNHKT